MTDKFEKPQVVFSPGCFDHFEGTQEELDELMAEIHRLVDSGELFEKATMVHADDLDEEDFDMLRPFLENSDTDRKLQ
jgi:hypothetical protein